MMKPWFQSCSVSLLLTTDSTRSSPTSSPAAMIRRTCAPIFVWFCTFQRKMSPTLMCTRFRSAASRWLWVPLPLPCTPMITYLRMSSAWHTGRRHTRLGRPVSPGMMVGYRQAEPALEGTPRLAVDQLAQLRPVVAQPVRVDEAGQVVRPALVDHDAVQEQPRPFGGDVELPRPVPGQVDRQHHRPLPRAVQVIEPLRQPPGLRGQGGEQTHGRIMLWQRYSHGMDDASPAPGAAAAEDPGPSGPVWRFLLKPRWLGWHLL